ncbi:MAG: response regulator [Methanoregula sp.]
MTDTILIVDDSSFIVDGLVSILKKKYNPLAVYGGQQCLEILKKERPSIIILDIMMEPMDGWETLARIKENPATRHIPVLMFSAKKISAEEAEEHRISIDDFVSKPVTPKKLIEAIEKVLTRQKANRECIESWRAAGIGQDRIDEYTSLVTNQEVDVSLLQNMKVQLSLIRDEDTKARADLEAVIMAIEARIEQERLLEAKLSSDIQESIAKDSEMKEGEGPVPVMHDGLGKSLPLEGESGTDVQPESAGSSGISDAEVILSAADDILPEAKIPEIVTVPDVRVPENILPDAEAIPDTPESGSLIHDSSRGDFSLNVPEITVSEVPPADKSQSGHVFSGPSLPEKGSEIFHSISLPREQSLAGISEREEKNSDPDKTLPVAEPKQPAVTVPRTLSARTIDNNPGSPGASTPSPFGSGTDTSLRMGPYKGRSSGDKGTSPKGDRVPGSSPPGGFLSGIISAILGIFKRPGKK